MNHGKIFFNGTSTPEEDVEASNEPTIFDKEEQGLLPQTFGLKQQQ